MDIITDKQIQAFIAEKKTLPEDFEPHPKAKASSKHHNCYDCDVVGENGNNYKIIVRQSKLNPLDFSVIFGIVLSGNTFILKRYNGDSHIHTNKLEGNQIEGFHIHQATERYQLLGAKGEFYAEKATKYSDINSAIKVMIAENNFAYPIDNLQKRLK